MRTADRFSVPRGAVRYGGGGGGGAGGLGGECGPFVLVVTVSMMTVHTRHYGDKCHLHITMVKLSMFVF